MIYWFFVIGGLRINPQAKNSSPSIAKKEEAFTLKHLFLPRNIIKKPYLHPRTSSSDVLSVKLTTKVF